MRGGRTFISSLVVYAAAPAALAQTPEYLPLDVGNVWIYRAAGTGSSAAAANTVVEVTEYRELEGKGYYALRNYRAGTFWVRNDGTGKIWQYDESSKQERLWYDFARKQGESYTTALPTCCGRAAVVSTAATAQVALGWFENVFHEITYPGVFQVGITKELFLPYVGLVFRSENTGGPSMRSQDLIYARLSGVTVLNAGGLGFGVAAENGAARVFVNNQTGKTLRVVFASGQTFEIVIRDSEGREVYRWSEGKGFTLALRPVDLLPGETSWPVLLPAVEGAAVLEAELVTIGQKFRASIPYPKP